MPEKIPQENNERSFEHIPTKEEVLEIIGRYAEKYIIERELSDEQGLYLLEAKTQDTETGDKIEYEYMRKGRFPNHNEASETEIHVIFYAGEVPRSGYNIAFLNKAGEWENV